MANGLMGFPQFAPGGKGGLIPTIQMPQTRMSFPTPRGGGGGSREVNPFAGLAPHVADWLGERLSQPTAAAPSKPAPPASAEENEFYTLADILQEQGSIEQANYLADQLGLPKPPKRGRKWIKPLLNIAGAAAFKDPAEQAAYLRTSGDIAARDAARGTTRAEFIADYTKEQLQDNITHGTVYLPGTGIIRNADITNKGNQYILSRGIKGEDETLNGTLVPAGQYYLNPDWVRGDPPTAEVNDLADTARDSDTNFIEARNEIEATADVLKSTQKTINNIVGNLIKQPDMATWLEPVVRFGKEIGAAVKAWNTTPGVAYKLKVTTDSGAAPEENESLSQYEKRTGNAGHLTWYQPGAGEGTSRFVKGGEVLKFWNSRRNPRTGEEEWFEDELDLTRHFGDQALNAEFRSALIGLAYQAAAANGQTGRTLSDRDLALHLQALGVTFGGSGGIRTPDAALRAITSWYGGMLEKISTRMQALEDGGMGHDYRRLHEGERTPWSDIYLYKTQDLETGETIITTQTDEFGEPTNRQLIRPLPVVWLNQKDPALAEYIRLLIAAQKSPNFGPGSIPREPLGSSINWNRDILQGVWGGQTPETGTAPGGVIVPPGGLGIPKPGEGLKKRKGPTT